MPWPGTKTDMSDVGGDLVLDAGAREGSYVSYWPAGGVNYIDTGDIARWTINLQFDAEEDGSFSDENNEIDVKLEIGLNSANPTVPGDWSEYEPFINGGEYDCRYYRIRATVTVDPSFGNRPKFTRFEENHTPPGSIAAPASVDGTATTPTGSEDQGHRYIVISPATADFANKQKQIAELIETTDRTWGFFIPSDGDKVRNLADGWDYIFEGDFATGSWVPRGLDNANPHKDQFVGGVRVVGAKDFDWDTDGGGDIGALAANRPDEIHAKTRITINGVDVVAGGGATPYYEILDSTATAADIQTALNDADNFVVYLKPGAYALGNNNISVPAGKALVGLGGFYQGTGTEGPVLTIQVDATNRIQLNNSSRLKNLKLRFAAASTAGNEMIETSTNDGVEIEGVNVDGSLVGAGAGIVSWAILGAVKKVSHCNFNRCAGIYVNAAIQDEGGRSEISNIHWLAHSSDTSSSMIGVRIDAGGGPVNVNGVHGESGYGTLYVAATDIMASQIWAESPGIYGVFWSGDDGHLSNVFVDGGAFGCRISGDKMTVTEFYARDTSNVGFWLNGGAGTGDDCTLESIHTFNCGGTSAPGIHCEGMLRGNLSNLSSQSAGTYGVWLETLQNSVITGVHASQGGQSGTTHHGIFIQSCVRSSFSALTSYQNGFGTGIQATSCTDCSISSVTTIDNGIHGFTLSTCTDCSVASISSQDNLRGVYLNNSDYNSLTGITANDNTDGVFVDGGSDYNSVTGVTAKNNSSDGMDIAANCVGNLFANVVTQGNTSNGVLGGNAGGAANNTLHGHVSHGDGTNRTLGTGWNTADLW